MPAVVWLRPSGPTHRQRCLLQFMHAQHDVEKRGSANVGSVCRAIASNMTAAGSAETWVHSMLGLVDASAHVFVCHA